MQQLQRVLSYWRGALSLCVMYYIHSRFYGFAAWVIAALVAFAFHRLLTSFFPVRARAAFDDTSHGTASFATNREIDQAGNLAPQMVCDRYPLGVALEPFRRGPVNLLHRREAARRSPYITTGTKFACSGGRVDDGHLITIGSAGSGKGIATVQPVLRCYGGPAVVFDPKGENFMRTVDARLRLGHRICLIDPFGEIPEGKRAPYLARLNPLDALEAFYVQGNHAAVVDECAAIAEMLVVREGSERDPHWNEKATSFIRAAMMFVTYGRGYQDRQKTPLTLSTVKECIYKYFSEGDEGIQTFVKRCSESPYLQATAGQVAMIAPTERSSVLSTVLRHTDFLESPNVAHSLGATDFNLLDLKTQNFTVYLVLPANNLKAYSRLARLWVGSLLRAMMRDSLTVPRWRVLFMLDEVAQLGQMDPLEQAVSLGRGYGIDVWLIFQDIFQMKDAYGDRWESFLANARVQQFVGVQDVTTAEYVSKKLGQSTIQTLSRNHSTGLNSGSSWSGTQNHTGGGSSTKGGSAGRSSNDGMSVQQAGRALLQPDEVMRLSADQLLIFFASQKPVLAQKCSVLNQAVADALDAVRAIDPPVPDAPHSRIPGAMSPAFAQEYRPIGGVTAGALQMAQTHVAEHEHARGHGL